MNNTGNKEIKKCDLIGIKSDVFDEKIEDFEELTKEAYERVTKRLQTIYTLRNIVPNRMQTLTVTNSDINLSDETKLKKRIANEINNSFEEIINENELGDFLNPTEIEKIRNINVNEIILDSIEIDSDISNEKVAAVVGSFDNKLINIDIKNLLNMSSFSVTGVIRSLVALSLSVMDAVDVNAESIEFNYFKLIPLIISSAVKIYEEIVEPIDKDLYPLIYFIVTAKDIRNGVDQNELVSAYITSNDEPMNAEEVIEDIDKLIDYNILKKDNDNKIYLITDIKTKEVDNRAN